MLDEAPHILTVREVTEELNEYGDVSSEVERWDVVTECFCHDNSQMQQVTVNGKLWTYSYHVVYEGSKIPLGKMVRCVSGCGCHEVGRGIVRKNAECYSQGLKGRCDLWLE